MVAVAEAGADAPRAERLTYSGRRGPLYRIFLTNLGLSLATLTIYRFWGRARMRRYLWGQTEFQGDRFEWTGTGGEMFRGFLMAAGLLLMLALPLMMLQLLAPEAVVELSIMQVVYVVIFVFLGSAASFWALRYRLSRTRWRGIRAALAGSGWSYALRAFGWKLLSAVTLTLTKPLSDVALARYRIGRLSLGSAAAHCSARAGAVYGRYIAAWVVTWVATAALIALFFVFIGASIVMGLATAAETEADIGSDPLTAAITSASVSAVVATVGTYLLVVLIWIACSVSYTAALLRHVAATTEVAGLSFALTFRTMALLRLVIGNWLITVFTLGLGLPIVLDRKARFLARHLEARGVLDGAAIGQSSDRGPKRGEGLVDLLDLGAV